ncbi:MAG TPA: TetR/AcrR family transcriptional regulator [Patescibacteria group bacterium]|nr:TetR/AcrR family transcriptional regulator [Patescibacteria group bacterium]
MTEIEDIHKAGQREIILTDAMSYFLQNGVREVNETDLFKSIGISPNAFYSFFKNKEDLLEQAVRLNIERDRIAIEQLRAKAKNSVEELMMLLKRGVQEFQKISPVYISDVMNYYPMVNRIGLQNLQEFTLNMYTEILNRGVRDGHFRRDINIQVVARVIIENVFVFLNYRAFPPEQYSHGEVLRGIYLYYFRGLCSQKSMHMVDDYFASNSF